MFITLHLYFFIMKVLFMSRFINRSKFLSMLLAVSAFGTGRSQAVIDKKSAAIGAASTACVSAAAFLQ